MKFILLTLILFIFAPFAPPVSLTSLALAADSGGFHQQIYNCMDSKDADCQETCGYCHTSPGKIETGESGDLQYCIDCHDDKQLQAEVTFDNTALQDQKSAQVLHEGHREVLCTTCHDPHIGEPGLLRMSNQNSALCLSCHNK